MNVQIVTTGGTFDKKETGVKVVVFTGAMQPARLRTTGTPFNLGVAIGAFQTVAEGIFIAMNSRIFEANMIRKNRAASRFEKG